MTKRLNTLTLCNCQDAQKDCRRYFYISQSTVTIGGRNLQVLRHHIQLEALQAGQETARQLNSIQTIHSATLTQQARLIRQEIEIKIKVMSNQRCIIRSEEKVG